MTYFRSDAADCFDHLKIFRNGLFVFDFGQGFEHFVLLRSNLLLKPCQTKINLNALPTIGNRDLL